MWRLLAALAVLGVATSASSRRGARNLGDAMTRCDGRVDGDAAAILARAQQAELVFTGKVIADADADAAPGFRGFLVAVKRVLRGGVGGVVTLLVPRDADADLGAACRTIMRVHHTAIFLARRGKHGALQATSDPLAITLGNLDLVDAAVKDLSYRPRARLPEEPCETTHCAWGALCVTDGAGAARCECPAECPGGDAVCGTDDVTYSSQCELRRKACLQRDNTRVKHAGACGKPTRRHR